MPLHGTGAGGEDIEDDPGAVEDLALEGVFQVALLAGPEVGVDHQDVGVVGAGKANGVIELAGAHEGGGHRATDAEQSAADDIGAGGFDEFGQFVKGRVGGPFAEFGEAL